MGNREEGGGLGSRMWEMVGGVIVVGWIIRGWWLNLDIFGLVGRIILGRHPRFLAISQ